MQLSNLVTSCCNKYINLYRFSCIFSKFGYRSLSRCSVFFPQKYMYWTELIFCITTEIPLWLQPLKVGLVVLVSVQTFKLGKSSLLPVETASSHHFLVAYLVGLFWAHRRCPGFSAGRCIWWRGKWFRPPPLRSAWRQHTARPSTKYYKPSSHCSNLPSPCWDIDRLVPAVLFNITLDWRKGKNYDHCNKFRLSDIQVM